ncbi:GNAT family N-acetyltransferase [Macellibacteroides fermentans]|uniref:GNAT family N-acetyltransferase n=1 Tax=Macellibacteroides fermentans TaxID=879969 RepID=UPI002C369B3B|nr:GNAT family N-acetyltransferase [Macellibacteroides fermentans]
MKDIEQLKSLWKSLFGDTEAFISLFFHEVVREENIRVLEEKGRILSALYMLPYPFRIWNQEVTASYISGAGTLPEAQGRGLMRRLLIDSFKEMERRQIPLSILIPAEPWLYGFYEKSGYVTVFAYNQQVYPPKEQRFVSATDRTSTSSVGYPPKEQRLGEDDLQCGEETLQCGENGLKQGEDALVMEQYSISDLGDSFLQESEEEGVRLGEDNLQEREDSLRYGKDGLQCGEDDLQYSENGLKYGEDAILSEKYSISDLGDSFLQKREDLMGACFSYFDQRLRERNACILHSYANFRTIVHDYAISDGKIWVALNNEHIPVGIIFTVPAGGSSFVAKELVADSEEVKEVLLRTALNHYHASSGIYRTVVLHASPTADFSTIAAAASIGTSEFVSNASSEEGQTIPFGMARIIDAYKVLSMWAAVNPERRMIIHLSDPLLTNNNGSYIIENGKCFKTTNNEGIQTERNYSFQKGIINKQSDTKTGGDGITGENAEDYAMSHLIEDTKDRGDGTPCNCHSKADNEAFEVLTMDIGQLAHFLIYPEHPFMSLMFD